MADRAVLAEVSVEPTAAGEEHRRLVEAAIAVLRESSLRTSVGPMSTLVEGPLDEVFALVGSAHEAAAARSHRVVTTVRMESRDGGPHLDDRAGDVG